MKKRNNKGYIGIDISISLIIIIILMPIIIAMTNNINLSNARINRKAQSISIATNVMESVKAILAEEDGEELVKKEANIYGYVKDNVYNASVINDTGNYTNGMTLKLNDVLYKLEIINDYNEEDLENYYTIVKAKVTYPVGSKKETLELRTEFKKGE